MRAAAKRWWPRVQRVLSNPVVRPAEVWAMRLLLGYMAIHFGLKV